jgi:hypothetical protein
MDDPLMIDTITSSQGNQIINLLEEIRDLQLETNELIFELSKHSFILSNVAIGMIIFLTGLTLYKLYNMFFKGA